MKTNILRYFLATLVTCILASCSGDFLDEKNPNETTEDHFWKTIADAESALATTYAPIRNQMEGYFGAYTGFQNQNVRGDDVFPLEDDPDAWKITIFNNTPNTGLLPSDWSALYTSISRANTVIKKTPEIDATQPEKDAIIAEAHFLRAWNYFILAINWGDVPLRLDPENSMAPMASVTEIWSLIESDLKIAKASLPAVRPATQYGRASKGAAIAYLGKAYLYQGKMQEAKTELDEIVGKAPYNYGLVDDPEDNYTATNEFNKESVFEINYSQHGTGGIWNENGANSMMGNALPQFFGTSLGGGWSKIAAAPFIIDEFFKEERPVGSESKFDKRIYANFFFKYSDYGDVKPDEAWYGEKEYNFDQIWDEQLKGKFVGGNNPNYPDYYGKPGRFVMKKFTRFWDAMGDNCDYAEKPDNNLRVMRYAEVLLMHAEAAAKTGDLSAAINDLHLVRDRAGLTRKNWANADEIMKEVEHQRLLEFWMEGQRFYDLKRWYSYSEIKDIFIRNNKRGAQNFQEKHLYYPIPQGEINSNTEAVQNPKW